jgi:phage terminase large subunit
MLRQENLWDDKNWNATDKIYRTGESIIEFFSVEQPEKVHGPSRDILFVNECINIEYETYRQMAIRTRKVIFLDFNPCFEFWVDEKVLPRREAALVHSTYRDNNYLTPEQIEEIESNMGDEEWWKVYGLGETGTNMGLVMRNWDIVESMPEIYKKRWTGIDFGYSNHPAAIVDVRLSEGELWIDELLYAKGYDNTMLAKHLRDCGIVREDYIVADCAESKSIAEINSIGGFTVIPSVKGADSINVGISILNRYRKHITSRSLNVIKEFRNYRWNTDENGDPTNKPVDKFNHAIDAIRYLATSFLMESDNLIRKMKRI